MKQLKIITHIIPFILLIQYSSFSKVSKKTIVGQEKSYTSVTNNDVNFKSLTFGDFQFAMNEKTYKKIRLKDSKFKDILFYAKTKEPEYEYFVLLNPKEYSHLSKEYYTKDTILNGNTFVLLISNHAPKSDLEFISENFYSFQE